MAFGYNKTRNKYKNELLHKMIRQRHPENNDHPTFCFSLLTWSLARYASKSWTVSDLDPLRVQTAWRQSTKKNNLKENLRQELQLNFIRKVYVSAPPTDGVTLMVSRLFTRNTIVWGLTRDNSEVVNSPIEVSRIDNLINKVWLATIPSSLCVFKPSFFQLLHFYLFLRY